MIIEKKLSKYLIYATGEIVLLVIGILIAIQLNQWNESNKERVLEKLYYCQFLDNVIQDEIQLNDLMKKHKIRIKASNELLGLLQSKNPDLASIVQMQLKSVGGSGQHLVIHNAAYEDVKSSGNLKIITDKLMKGNLSNYYSKLEGMIENPKGNNNIMIQRFLTHSVIGVGMAHSSIVTDYVDERYVDKSILLKNSNITEADRKYLTKEALLYLGINATNSQHIKSMQKEAYEMKKQLKMKCET
jgi:hypothetical protein